jgi:nitric oxide reductase NorE protein
MGTGGVNQAILRAAISDDESTPVSATRHLPGEPGVWVLIFGDLVLFGAMFAAFMYQRSLAPEMFDESRYTLSIGIGLTNTLILLTSSLFVVTAMRAIRLSRPKVARAMFAGALASGLAFVGLKVVEYSTKVSEGHVPTENSFYQYYFILTGVHLFHVLIGIGVLVLLIVLARHSEHGSARMALIEGGGCFWHLVDSLWIVLFPLLYLVS